MKTAEKKAEILIVSFGTSVKSARERSLEQITHKVADAFPEHIVEHCFTSKFVRGKIEREEGSHILSPEEAIEKAIENGVSELYALPTHLMDGIELTAFRELLASYGDRFDVCSCAGPLAETEADRHALIGAVAQRIGGMTDEDTGVVLVGHGTKDPANDLYATLQQDLGELGYSSYVIGTIEAKPDFADALHCLKEKELKKVFLIPFLVVAGDHALNDISGDAEDSWQSRLIRENFGAATLKEGLGELAGVHQLLISHAERLMRQEG